MAIACVMAAVAAACWQGLTVVRIPLALMALMELAVGLPVRACR